jgi:hypothetical protein
LTQQQDPINHPERPDETTPGVAGFRSEYRPASRRNRGPASNWNAWPASSESAAWRCPNTGNRQPKACGAGAVIAIADDHLIERSSPLTAPTLGLESMPIILLPYVFDIPAM